MRLLPERMSVSVTEETRKRDWFDEDGRQKEKVFLDSSSVPSQRLSVVGRLMTLAPAIISSTGPDAESVT